MSQKRSSKPIRITLTEDQISDIIQSAAKTRRSLSAQSLEDRIAPGTLPGIPLVDPSMVDPGPSLSTGPDISDSGPGLGLGGPPTPPGFMLPPTGSGVSDLNPMGPEGAPPLGTLPPTGDHVFNQDSFTPPPGFTPPPPVVPNPLFDPATHHSAVMHTGHGPVIGDGYIAPPTGAFEDANLNPNVPANPPAVDPGSTPGMPTPQEFEEHRRNILRQLRGI